MSSYIFRSKSNVALVRFVSNSVGKWPGFNLTFSHVERIESKYSFSISNDCVCIEIHYTIVSRMIDVPILGIAPEVVVNQKW